MLKTFSQDYRRVCLALAVLALPVLFLRPVEERPRSVYNLTFIVDITRSMNVLDYKGGDRPLSRLEFVKHALRESLTELPCGSKVGLGVFTERRSTLLFEPIEVCAAYAEIDAAMAAIDWRMAWAADSNIAQGLKSTLEMLRDRDGVVVFLTDGHEAPPVNPRYRPDFSALKGKASGLIVGVGGLTAAPIPKFGADGQAAGFYGADDVPQRSSFGESNLDPSRIEGYDARNAPFGRAKAAGSEHLSALHEAYLQELALEAGLGYARFGDAEALPDTLRRPEFAEARKVAVDVRWQPAAFALLAVALAYTPFGPLRRLRNRIPKQLTVRGQ